MEMKQEVAKIHNEEIDLIDLFKMLYRGKKILLIIWLFIAGVSLAGMSYMKSNEKTRIYKEVKTENIDLSRFKTKEIDIKSVMSQGEEIPYYEVGGFQGQISEMEIDKKIAEISITIEEEKERQLEALASSYEVKLKELRSLNKEFNEILAKEPREIYGNEKMMEILNEKYPVFMINYRNIRADYEELELEKRSFTDQKVERVSELKSLKLKSKGKLIGISGVILGLILGITAVFMREFWCYLKKELKKK